MAQFKPKEVLSSNLDTTKVVTGQMILISDTGDLYFDSAASGRIHVSGIIPINVNEYYSNYSDEEKLAFCKKYKNCLILDISKNMIYGYCLCSKHMHQLINHGRFLDNIPRTIKDLNGYVIRNNIVIFDKILTFVKVSCISFKASTVLETLLECGFIKRKEILLLTKFTLDCTPHYIYWEYLCISDISAEHDYVENLSVTELDSVCSTRNSDHVYIVTSDLISNDCLVDEEISTRLKLVNELVQ